MITNLHIYTNGKEVVVPVTLTQELLAELTTAMTVEKPLTGWEKPAAGAPCYYEDALGRIQKFTVDEASEAQLNLLYSKANCFCSSVLAENIARADQLFRELRRFAIERRTEKFKAYDGYTIGFNDVDKCIEVGITAQWASFGDIVFETEADAHAAIEKFYSELMWYFTSRRDTI